MAGAAVASTARVPSRRRRRGRAASALARILQDAEQKAESRAGKLSARNCSEGGKEEARRARPAARGGGRRPASASAP